MTNRYYFKFKEVSVGYFFIFLIVFLISIVFKICMNPNGYLTYDSFEYLAQASNMISFFSEDQYYSEFVRGDFNGTWPLGYPIIISIIGLFSFFNVFIASKLLNFIVITIMIFYLKRHYEKEYKELVVVLFPGVIYLYFVYSLSELLFICSLIFVIDFVSKKGVFFGIILFAPVLIRYVGVFMGVYYILEGAINKYSKINFDNIITFSVISFSYFLGLKFTTGFYSGANRVGTEVDYLNIIEYLVLSLVSSFSFFEVKHIYSSFGALLFVFGFVPIIFILISFIKGYKDIYIKIYELKYFVLGISYLIFYFSLTIILKWHHPSNLISERLLIPGVFILLIPLFSIFIRLNRDKLHHLVYFSLLVLLIKGFVFPFKDYLDYEGLTYFRNMENIRTDSLPIEKRDLHLKYLNSCD